MPSRSNLDRDRLRELERVQFRVLEIKPQLHRPSRHLTQIRAPLPRRHTIETALRYRVGIPEFITRDIGVIGRQDFDPKLAGSGAPLLPRRFDIEMQLRATERESAGDQLAVLRKVRSADGRVPRQPLDAVDRDETIQASDRQSNRSGRAVPQFQQGLGRAPVPPGVEG